MDVMFYEVFLEEEKAIKKFLPKDIDAGFTADTIQAHKKSPAPPAALISIRTQSVIPKEWAKSLEGILTRSTGYDHIIEYCRQVKKEIKSGYLGDYCSYAVAEAAILLAMSLLRKLNRQTKQFDTFDRDGLTGREMKGQNLLVVGVGHIGREILNLAKSLGMNIKGVDIDKRHKDVEYTSLDQGLPWADVIVCAASLTESSRGLLNYKNLSKAKRGACLVNVSRGEITPVEDIKEVLDEDRLRGVALDVFPDEPDLAEHLRGNQNDRTKNSQIVMELKDEDNVVLTPHNAFNTLEAVERKARLSVESATEFLKSKTFPSPVPFK